MKDPAFLFYPGDASEDTQFMNRLERGSYFDILKAQKKFGKFSKDQIKKVLGSDFDTCWGALELVLKLEDGFYYIEWVAEKIDERKKFSDSRRKNRTKKEEIPTSDKEVNNICSTSDKDMVIEIEDVNTKKEKKSWDTMPKPEHVGELPKDHIDNAIMFVKLTKQTDINQLKVTGMWAVFKTQNLTGKDYYADIGAVYKHFSNWIKKQEFKKETYEAKPHTIQQNPVYKSL